MNRRMLKLVAAIAGSLVLALGGAAIARAWALSTKTIRS